MDVLQDHIDVRATEQPKLPIRLCQRAPWVCCKTNQLRARWVRATEQPSYRGAVTPEF